MMFFSQCRNESDLDETSSTQRCTSASAATVCLHRTPSANNGSGTTLPCVQCLPLPFQTQCISHHDMTYGSAYTALTPEDRYLQLNRAAEGALASIRVHGPDNSYDTKLRLKIVFPSQTKTSKSMPWAVSTCYMLLARMTFVCLFVSLLPFIVICSSFLVFGREE